MTRPRPKTRPVRFPGGERRTTVQRSCNGCDRPLGDATPAEINAAAAGQHLPDVRGECPACTPAAPGREWVLELPFVTPLSLNGRGGVHTRARLVKMWRHTARALAHSAGIPPLRAMTAELRYEPKDRRHRDPLNLAAALKACEDGLVDYNAVPDDDQRYVLSTMPTIGEPTGGRAGRLTLTVREIDLAGGPR